jgi:hypothetical protein
MRRFRQGGRGGSSIRACCWLRAAQARAHRTRSFVSLVPAVGC